MAKEQFERIKVHVNPATIGPRLQALGFTARAVHELTNGQLPSFPGDRTLVVRRFLELVEGSGSITWYQPDHK